MNKKLLTAVTTLALTAGVFGTTFAADKPAVKILATGGTIAGSAPSNTQMTGYKAGALGIDVLINAVPQMKDVAVVSGEQVANIGSQDMTNDVWLKLADRCNKLLAQDDVKGVVITHGTDTLEETAYFLNLVVKSDKPVVLVGAMRPATAISADGPVNLLNAVKLAASPKAVGKGVLVALGYFTGGEPYFYKESLRKHTKNTVFDVSGLKELPRVDIVYTHVNDDRVLVDAAVKAGAKGIVYAGSGMGSIHKDAEPGLAEAVKKGVTVVRASRVGNGMVVEGSKEWTDEGFLNGDNLNPQKARVLLQLALTKTSDPKAIQKMFDEY